MTPAEREALALEHLALTRKIAKRFAGRCAIGFDDLVQTAATGLLKAAECFEPSRGAGFPGYAWKCMTRRILDEIRRESRHGSTEPIDDTFENSYSGPPSSVAALDDSIDIRTLRSSLSPRQRRLIDARFLRGQTFAEGGAEEGLGEHQAGVIVRGALLEMRRIAEPKLPKAA
jgi:RNA polymerase sigma factor (sigma-70 family)